MDELPIAKFQYRKILYGPCTYVKTVYVYFTITDEGRIHMVAKAAEREGKRHPISFRTTEEVREKLERAASAAGRSLTQEIEYRLEQSFLQSDMFKAYFGAEDADEIMRELNLIVIFNLARSGKSVIGDETEIDALRSQIDGFLVRLKDKEAYDVRRSAYETMLEYDRNAWKNPPALKGGLASSHENASEQMPNGDAPVQHVRSTRRGKTNVRKAR